MPGDPTSRLGLIPMDGDEDLVEDIDGIYNDLVTKLESIAAIYDQGTLAARPALGKRGRYYFATDVERLFVDEAQVSRSSPYMHAARTAAATPPRGVLNHHGSAWVTAGAVDMPRPCHRTIPGVKYPPGTRGGPDGPVRALQPRISNPTSTRSSTTS